MNDFDTEYFQLREREELARAESSPNPSVAGIHRDLAARYAALIRRRNVVLKHFNMEPGQLSQAKPEVGISISAAST
ncbi:hypothetical protein [Sphingomonas sp. MMS24-J13]|uniref:hypothetical protein n=1 Tax=Sphingomonas sp. MMS24-J13 TaxID=3238686 RepID=UPI00384D2247